MAYVIAYTAHPVTRRIELVGPYVNEMAAIVDANLMSDRLGIATTVLRLTDPGKLSPLHRRRPLPRR